MRMCSLMASQISLKRKLGEASSVSHRSITDRPKRFYGPEARKRYEDDLVHRPLFAACEVNFSFFEFENLWYFGKIRSLGWETFLDLKELVYLLESHT